MKVLKDGRINCRVKITGTYLGKTFTYTDPEGTDGSPYYWPDGDPSIYWWSEGNFSCDCNRCEFIGIKNMECGDLIFIDRIEPVDYPEGESLILNESINIGA